MAGSPGMELKQLEWVWIGLERVKLKEMGNGALRKRLEHLMEVTGKLDWRFTRHNGINANKEGVERPNNGGGSAKEE